MIAGKSSTNTGSPAKPLTAATDRWKGTDMPSNRVPRQNASGTSSTPARVLVRTVALGGMLLQAATGGCEQALGDASAALAEAVMGGLGEGLGDLAQAAIIGAFI